MNRLFPLCLLTILFLPIPAFADLVINEIAWMGTLESATSEWIELYNNSGEEINLEGWSIEAQDGSPDINLSGTIEAGEFFLLERSDDNSLPGVTADLIYTGALSNSGETLILKEAGTEVGRVDASGGWPAGDNNSKETMQLVNNVWITAPPTPKAINSGQNEEPPNDGDGSTDTPDANNDGGSGAASGPLSSHYSPLPISNVGEMSHIYISAGRDRLGVVGAPLFFEAFTFYESGARRIGGGSFNWSFGDGFTGRGQQLFHTYSYPGEYIVSLNASYGLAEAVSRANVTIVDPKIEISAIEKDFVEITNSSVHELNLHNWELLMGNTGFTFPKDTIIKATSTLAIPREVTKIGGAGIVKIYNPNGDMISEMDSTKSEINSVNTALQSVKEEVKAIKKTVTEPKKVTRVQVNKQQRVKPTNQEALVIESFEIDKPEGFFKTIFSLPNRAYQYIKRLIF